MPIDIGGGQRNKELVCWGVAEYSPWVGGFEIWRVKVLKILKWKF